MYEAAPKTIIDKIHRLTIGRKSGKLKKIKKEQTQ